MHAANNGLMVFSEFGLWSYYPFSVMGLVGFSCDWMKGCFAGFSCLDTEGHHGVKGITIPDKNAFDLHCGTKVKDIVTDHSCTFGSVPYPFSLF